MMPTKKTRAIGSDSTEKTSGLTIARLLTQYQKEFSTRFRQPKWAVPFTTQERKNLFRRSPLQLVLHPDVKTWLIQNLGGIVNYWRAVADWVAETYDQSTPYDGRTKWQELVDALDKDAALLPSLALIVPQIKIPSILNAYATRTQNRIDTSRKSGGLRKGLPRDSNEQPVMPVISLATLAKDVHLLLAGNQLLSNTGVARLLQRRGKPYDQFAIRTLRRYISQIPPNQLASKRRLANK